MHPKKSEKLKVIYVAGPYSSNQGMWGVQENINAARNVATIIWQSGGIAICPHMNSAMMDGIPGTNPNSFIEGGLELLRRCDAVALVDGWEGSHGTIREITEAAKMKIPILYNVNDIFSYLKKAKDEAKRSKRSSD